jgi:hypothetical protein
MYYIRYRKEGASSVISDEDSDVIARKLLDYVVLHFEVKWFHITGSG